MNQSVIIGRLTSTPTLRNTESGVDVTNFTLATTRTYKNKDGIYETDFINCVAWNNVAIISCEHLKKGDMISVSGSLQNKEIQTKSGDKVTVTELLVDRIKFLTTKRGIDDNKEFNIKI